MRKNLLINTAILISVSVFILAGCSTNTQNENTTVGAVSGGVIGGLAGSLIGQGTGRVVAVGVGAVAGAIIGGMIGHSMDSSDNRTMSNTLNRNPVHQSSSWKNSKTGTQYTVTPTSNVMAYNGNDYCRKYESEAVINGKSQTQNGIACRQADGKWQTVES